MSELVLDLSTNTSTIRQESAANIASRSIEPTAAQRAAGLSVPKADFSVQFRTVYAAEGAPLGAIAGSVPAWVEAQIAALPTSPEFTAAQRDEALDRWAAANSIQRANPLIAALALVWFGDAAKLSDSDPAIVAAEITRVNSVTDQLFINAEALAS